MSWDDSAINDDVFKWVTHIFPNDESSIDFDEIYSSIFDSVGTPRLDLYISSLHAHFTSKLEELREEVLNIGGDITAHFGSLCQTVLTTIRKLSSAFYPAKFANVDITDLLNRIVHRILFSENSPHIARYWESFAHSLPGTLDLETEQPNLKSVLDLLRGSRYLPLFVKGVEEATDAFALYISSTMIPRDGFTPIRYLGTCHALLENEQRLWSVFKDPKTEDRLRKTLLNGLIKSVAPEIFFSPDVQIAFARAVFDDLRELPQMAPRFQALFYDDELQQSLVLSGINYFASALNALRTSLLKDGKPRALTPAEATATVQTFVDVFEKLELLGELLFSRQSFALDDVRALLRSELSERAFEANATFALYLHQCVEAMTADRDKRGEQEERLVRVRPLIAFLPDRREFLAEHYHQMHIRLFRTAGLQHALEDAALRIIEPFVPPDARDRYDGLLATLQASEAAHARWRAARPRSPLAVLLLTEDAVNGVGGQLGGLRVPDFLMAHAREFEAFYGGGAERKGQLQWLWEENMVVLRLRREGVYDVNLTVTLVLACVIVAVRDLGAPTIPQLAQHLGLPRPELAEALCRLLTRENMPLLVVRREGVMFNQGFCPRVKKLKVLAAKAFGLNRITVVDTGMYKACIVMALKAKRTMSEEEMRNVLRGRCRERREEYDEGKFTAAVRELEREYMAKGRRPGVWTYRSASD